MSGFSLLIVDNNFNDRLLFETFLKKEGFSCFKAPNGPSAIELLNKQEVDLVLMDVDLPGQNGFEIISEMKKDQSLKNIPVIFISAYDYYGLIDTAMKLGAQQYIRKPVNLNFLKNCIFEILEINPVLSEEKLALSLTW